MQLRVKNLNKGQRGFYVDGDLVFVDGGATSSFTGASAAERDSAADIEGLKVQSRVANDGEWTDHFDEEMPEEKPWIVIATDASGTDMKPVEGNGWFIGTAVAGERPDSPTGYKWFKVGADEEIPVSEPEPEALADNEPTKAPDYAELVKGNATDVVAAITTENAMEIGAAEEKREGGPRKGVMKAVEEIMEDK